MLNKLSQGHNAYRVRDLLWGSAKFVDLPVDFFNTVVVDEAHRLKNGTAYMYNGVNQVEDIVKASRVSIFFVDENQMIRPDDIGSINEIKRVAGMNQAEVIELELKAQFRCSGAEGYINWVTDVLHIQETGNFDGWEQKSFDFQIVDHPNKLYGLIQQKAEAGQSARVLAGYAWKWTNEQDGNRNANVADVCIPEKSFAMPWNSRQVGSTWAISREGIGQIGCVHTSQGLEFDYVGVIVGNDLRYDPNKGQFYTCWEDYYDIKGKQGLRNNPDELCRLVRNIYRILLSRGMKGCYVYFRDPATEAYFKNRLMSAGAK